MRHWREPLVSLSLTVAVACVLVACRASPSANQKQVVPRSEPSTELPTRLGEHDAEALRQLVEQGLKQKVPDLDVWTPEDAAQDLGKRIGDLSATQINLGTRTVNELVGVLKCCTFACPYNEVRVLDETYKVTAGTPFDEVCLNAAGLLRGINVTNETLLAPHADTLKRLLKDAERHITRRPSDLRFKSRLAILAGLMS
jgi:hypothetical protein